MAEPLYFRCPSCGAFNRVPAERAGEATKCGRCQKALPKDGAPQAVGGDELQRAIASSPVPVLVDFWAAWCGPCRMVAPTVDQLAHARAGRALVLKLDTEAAPDAAARFGIRGIPTFIVFSGGREVTRQSGALPLQALEALLQRAAA